MEARYHVVLELDVRLKIEKILFRGASHIVKETLVAQKVVTNIWVQLKVQM